MDYNKEYQKHYNKLYEKFENDVKLKLIESKNLSLKFGIICNELTIYYSKIVIDKLNIYKLEKLKLLFDLYRSSLDRYESNEINLAISNIIEPKFGDINLSELPKNYNLNKFILEIAEFDASKEICRLISINNQILEMFYELNNFDKFELRDHKGISVENYPIFIELHKILHPNYYNQFNNTTDETENDAIGLDAPQKTLLIEKLIKNASKWEMTDERKKAYIISKIIDKNIDNIRKTLAKSDKKQSEYSKKFINDIKIADEIISKLG